MRPVSVAFKDWRKTNRKEIVMSRIQLAVVGALALFIISGPLHAQDTDGDGMPDAWEDSHA